MKLNLKIGPNDKPIMRDPSRKRDCSSVGRKGPKSTKFPQSLEYYSNRECPRIALKVWEYWCPMVIVGSNEVLRVCDRWRLYIFRNGNCIRIFLFRPGNTDSNVKYRKTFY